MMTFIKTHVISLASGIAAIAFLVIGALGMMKDDVLKDMQTRAAVAGQINSLTSNVKNHAGTSLPPQKSTTRGHC